MMSTTTTTTTSDGSSARRTGTGRLDRPLLAAGIICLPAVVGALSGRITVLSLLATFVVVLTVVLFASAAGVGLLRLLDGSGGPPPSPLPSPIPPSPAHPSPDAVDRRTGPSPLGRVPVARVPADQAIPGDAGSSNGTDHPTTFDRRRQDPDMDLRTDPTLPNEEQFP